MSKNLKTNALKKTTQNRRDVLHWDLGREIIERQTHCKVLFFFQVLVGMFVHWLCHPNYCGWIWIKVSCGGVADSILVAVQFLSNLWRDSCQLWDIFYIFGSNSVNRVCNICTKKYNGKSSRTLWSMNHSIMVVISLDNSFYVFCTGSNALADKGILRVFLLLVSLHIDLRVFTAIHPLVELYGF